MFLFLLTPNKFGDVTSPKAKSFSLKAKRVDVASWLRDALCKKKIFKRTEAELDA